MHRYSEDEFAPNLLSTAGVDFKVISTMTARDCHHLAVYDVFPQQLGFFDRDLSWFSFSTDIPIFCVCVIPGPPYHT